MASGTWWCANKCGDPFTVEPRYHEGPIARDWQNLFPITRSRYIEVFLHIFYHCWGKENCSLYRGLRYIEVPLYFNSFI